MTKTNLLFFLENRQSILSNPHHPGMCPYSIFFFPHKSNSLYASVDMTLTGDRPPWRTFADELNLDKSTQRLFNDGLVVRHLAKSKTENNMYLVVWQRVRYEWQKSCVVWKGHYIIWLLGYLFIYLCFYVRNSNENADNGKVLKHC